MPRPKKKPRDPETGETVEDIGGDAGDHENVPRPDKMGKARKALSVKLAEARLKRLNAQNKKLALDYKSKTGGLVSLEVIMREVLAANVSVKNQVLAVIERANLPRESKLALRQEMIRALNDLAYERSCTTANL